MQSNGLRVQGKRLRVKSAGIRVQDVGCRVKGAPLSPSGQREAGGPVSLVMEKSV